MSWTPTDGRDRAYAEASPDAVSKREVEYDRIAPRWREAMTTTKGVNTRIESIDMRGSHEASILFGNGESGHTADPALITEAWRLHSKRWPVDFSMTDSVLTSICETQAFKDPEFHK